MIHAYCLIAANSWRVHALYTSFGNTLTDNYQIFTLSECHGVPSSNPQQLILSRYKPSLDIIIIILYSVFLLDECVNHDVITYIDIYYINK